MEIIKLYLKYLLLILFQKTMVVKEMEGFIKFPGIVPKVKMKGEKNKTKLWCQSIFFQNILIKVSYALSLINVTNCPNK